MQTVTSGRQLPAARLLLLLKAEAQLAAGAPVQAVATLSSASNSPPRAETLLRAQAVEQAFHRGSVSTDLMRESAGRLQGWVAEPRDAAAAWATLVSPYADHDQGLLILPEVDSVVVVGFEAGDHGPQPATEPVPDGRRDVRPRSPEAESLEGVNRGLKQRVRLELRCTVSVIRV